MSFRIRHVLLDDAAALGEILISANEHTFRDLVPPQCLQFTAEQSAANWRRTMAHGLDKGRFLDVAELDERVIGYVMGGPLLDDEFRRGELRQISIHPEYQRRGIGRLLVEHVARVFLMQNIRIVHVETLECSPHRGFYEHLGARLVAMRTHDWDGVLLPMCVYRWDDLTSLVIERAPATPRHLMDRIAENHYV